MTSFLRNDIQNIGDAIITTTCIGNKHSITNALAVSLIASDFPIPVKSDVGGIVAFNNFLGLQAHRPIDAWALSNNAAGEAIVQNVFECVKYSDTVAILWVAADSTTNQPVNNILLWNNTLVGARQNACYNSAQSVLALRTLWSFKNNSFDDDNIKTDTFSTDPSASGARVGNWSEVWGVGYAGNFGGNVNGIGTTSFSHTNAGGLYGLNSFETETMLSSNYQKYIYNAANTGDRSGPGLGNYRLLSSSPLAVWTCDWLLPYDIEGNARGGFDPPGAYASASPRKGGLFFAQ